MFNFKVWNLCEFNKILFFCKKVITIKKYKQICWVLKTVKHLWGDSKLNTIVYRLVKYRMTSFYNSPITTKKCLIVRCTIRGNSTKYIVYSLSYLLVQKGIKEEKKKVIPMKKYGKIFWVLKTVKHLHNS